MNHDHDQNNTSGQSGIDQETERRNRENETGEQSQQQSRSGQQQSSESGQAKADQSQDKSDGESGFVGSTGDQSSDYLTKGENQDFAPEGQGATDTDAGTSDIETGQSSNSDSTLEDGSDTSR